MKLSSEILRAKPQTKWVSKEEAEKFVALLAAVDLICVEIIWIKIYF